MAPESRAHNLHQVDDCHLIHVASPSALVTDPEYAALRHWLKNARTSAEAVLVEAKRRVRLDEG